MINGTSAMRKNMFSIESKIKTGLRFISRFQLWNLYENQAHYIWENGRIQIEYKWHKRMTEKKIQTTYIQQRRFTIREATVQDAPQFLVLASTTLHMTDMAFLRASFGHHRDTTNQVEVELHQIAEGKYLVFF